MSASNVVCEPSIILVLSLHVDVHCRLASQTMRKMARSDVVSCRERRGAATVLESRYRYLSAQKTAVEEVTVRKEMAFVSSNASTVQTPATCE